MTRLGGRKVILGTFYLALLMITADELYVKKQKAPRPSRYVGAVVAWMLMSAADEALPGLGAGFAMLATVGMALTNAELLDVIPGISPAAGGQHGGSGAPAAPVRPAGQRSTVR